MVLTAGIAIQVGKTLGQDSAVQEGVQLGKGMAVDLVVNSD